MQLPSPVGQTPSIPQPTQPLTVSGDFNVIKTNQIRKTTAGGSLSFLAAGGSPLMTLDDASGVCTLFFGLTLSGFGAGTGVVSVNAVDTAGVGFRALRVPN